MSKNSSIHRLLVNLRPSQVRYAFSRLGRSRTQQHFTSVLLLCLVTLSFSLTILAGGLSVAQTPQLPGLDTPEMREILDQGNLGEAVNRIEQHWENDYETYFGDNFPAQPQTAQEIAKTLNRLGQQTKKKPALIYAVTRTDALELILIPPNGSIVRVSVPEAHREALVLVAQQLVQEITNPRKRNTTSYLTPAQQLYQWLVAPLASALQAQKIDTLVFCVGVGLRTVPLAALHDGQQFLVEKYSLARIPAFKLIDVRYTDLKKAQVLAMGASDFSQRDNQQPLPAVPVELATISQLWPGESFLNEDFTLVNLQSQRLQQRFGIIHLATHAEFRPGAPSNSYIQFWDTELRLDQMRELGWNNPPLELLVLSACKTAVGDREVELGFAGLSVQAGVKSALASLWYVSDTGTLALMNEFYQQLRTAPIKAEALRQAQLALIQGKVRLENGRLFSSKGAMPLSFALASQGQENFAHPYYWAAFTIIGSPW